MRECYSGDIFVSAFYRQNEESFLEGIVKGLEHFGGTPQKNLPYADSYDTLYACVSGNTVKNAPIKTSVKIILPNLKRYDSLLKGGDAV